MFFGPFDYSTGDTIEVIAKYGGDQATNSTLADSGGLQTVDVHIGSLVIPEFGELLPSPLVAVSVISIALMLVLRRRIFKQR
ncbi:MAG: hypothetical protein WAS24_02310 [Thermoplasmata archaeon]